MTGCRSRPSTSSQCQRARRVVRSSVGRLWQDTNVHRTLQIREFCRFSTEAAEVALNEGTRCRRRRNRDEKDHHGPRNQQGEQ